MRTFVPPFMVFLGFGILVLLQSFFSPMHIGDMGGGNVHAFEACFYYCWPLYFITALLTQGLIVVPVWMAAASVMAKINIFIFTCLICVISAGAIAYIIWDRATGYSHLISLFLIMYFIQMAYWVANYFILLLSGTDAGSKQLVQEITE